MFLTLFIALLTYACMVFFTRYRTPIAVLGSGLLLVYGTISNAFPANLAFQRFPTEIVILIVVLALFSKIFENNGFFDYIGDKFIEISKGNKIIIAILIPLTIYLISLFMNNLSAVLLFTFISLELAVRLKLPVAPILVSVIIGSNIGGCPLPWADTPAVVLTLYSDFNLFDFLTKLFGPCAVYTFLLVLYTVWWCKREDKNNNKSNDENKKAFEVEKNSTSYFGEEIDRPSDTVGSRPAHPLPHGVPMPPPPPHLGPKHNELPKHENINLNFKLMGGYRGEKQSQSLWMKVWIPIILFTVLIALICIAPFLNVSIAYVSMVFLGIAIIIMKVDPEQLLNSLPIMDSLVFIAALFLIAGVLEYSGVLKTAVEYIMTFTNGNKYLITLCIMLSAFIIATFLSAGPAAATLLPICQQLSPIVGNRIVYAALALGILAGSSMLPWSATGGPVMLSEVSRFLRERKIKPEDRERIEKVFSLKYYLAVSIPFSFVILALSTVFLCIYLLFQ